MHVKSGRMRMVSFTALFWGGCDWLGSARAVKHLNSALFDFCLFCWKEFRFGKACSLALLVFEGGYVTGCRFIDPLISFSFSTFLQILGAATDITDMYFRVYSGRLFFVVSFILGFGFVALEVRGPCAFSLCLSTSPPPPPPLPCSIVPAS